jgi:hypothetical protein
MQVPGRPDRLSFPSAVVDVALPLPVVDCRMRREQSNESPNDDGELGVPHPELRHNDGVQMSVKRVLRRMRFASQFARTMTIRRYLRGEAGRVGERR